MKRQPESIENYLAQIARELRDLPASARDEEMREIESHLRAMIEARGDVAAVLRQFGKPRKVGRDLRRAWERKQPEAWNRFGFALLSGLLILAAFDVVRTKFGSYFEMPFDLMMKDTGAMILLRLAFHLLFLLSFLLVVFGGLGYITKAISPKRGMLAAALVVSLILTRRIANGGFEEPNFQSNAMLFLFLGLGYFTNISIGAYFGARHNRRLLARCQSQISTRRKPN